MDEKDVIDSDSLKEFQLLESWRENVLKNFENIENDQSWLCPQREINWYCPLQNIQKVVENKDRNKLGDNIPFRIDAYSSCSSGKTDVPDPEEPEKVVGIEHQTVTNLKHQNKENLGQMLNFPDFQMLQCVTPPSILDSSIICREFVEEQHKFLPVSSSTPSRSRIKKAFDFPKHIPPEPQFNATSEHDSQLFVDNSVHAEVQNAFDSSKHIPPEPQFNATYGLSKHDSQLSVDNSVHAVVQNASDNTDSKENPNSVQDRPLNETITLLSLCSAVCSLKGENEVSRDLECGPDNPGSKKNSNSADRGPLNETVTIMDTSASLKYEVAVLQESVNCSDNPGSKENSNSTDRGPMNETVTINNTSASLRGEVPVSQESAGGSDNTGCKNSADHRPMIETAVTVENTSASLKDEGAVSQESESGGQTAADNFERNGVENSYGNSCIPNIAHPKPSSSASPNLRPRTIQIRSRIPKLQFRSKLD